VRTIFASTTFVMTVALSLSMGVVAGYAVIIAILKLFGRKPATPAKPALLSTAAHASGD
jgi:hypothetical protein